MSIPDVDVDNFVALMSEVPVEVMITTFEEDWWTQKIVSINSKLETMKVKDLVKKKKLNNADIKFFIKTGHFSCEYRPTLI